MILRQEHLLSRAALHDVMYMQDAAKVEWCTLVNIEPLSYGCDDKRHAV